MDGAAPVVVIPFRLQESDWPLRVSFPIAVQNLIRYLTPGPLLGATELTTGQHVAFFPGKDGVQEVDVRRPDSGIDRVRAPFPPFADTAEPGVYTASEVGGSGRTSSFVVNFLPSRPAPVTGPRVLRFGEPAGGGSRAVGVPVSIAWPFGLMAVLILTVEWWFAFRR